MKSNAPLPHPVPGDVAGWARPSAVAGLLAVAVLAGGCFAPPPSTEREAAGRTIAEAFFDAMRSGDVTAARTYTTFTKDEQLAEYVPLFKDGKAEHTGAGILGTTNRLYLDYLIRHPDGSGRRVRVLFHLRTTAAGGWSGDRIETVEVMGQGPAK